MPDDVPEHLRPALSRFDEAVGALRTRRIRASRVDLPPIPPPDPRLLEQAAGRPDAPEQLRAVARAVRDGRTSWAEVAAGRGLDVPEIRDLIAASGPRMARKLAEAESEFAAEGEPPARPAPARHRRPGNGDDDGDLEYESYLY